MGCDAVEDQHIPCNQLKASPVMGRSADSDDVDCANLKGVIDDVNLLIPVRIKLHTTLLLSDRHILFARIEAVPGKVAVHTSASVHKLNVSPPADREIFVNRCPEKAQSVVLSNSIVHTKLMAI
jgi:hypothetical protein